MSRAALHNPGRPVALRLGTLELSAYSISGLATYVEVPAFELNQPAIDQEYILKFIVGPAR